jgi:hypothetical protein
MFKMHCIHQIVAFHRFKMLESQGRVKGITGVAKKAKSKTHGKDPLAKTSATVPTLPSAVGGNYSNPINCKLSF